MKMSTSFTGKPVTIGNPNLSNEFNEFARIQGLGPAMQRWLRESFNIHTVTDLANLPISRVLFQLEDEGKAFAHDQIEWWVRQARLFVAEQTSWQTFATFVVSLQSRQVGGQTEQRTTAYFLETDQKKIWSGIECNGVYELILDQLKHLFQLEPEVTVPMASESKIKSEPIAERQSVPEPIDASTGVKPEPTQAPEPTIQSEPGTENQPALATVDTSTEAKPEPALAAESAIQSEPGAENQSTPEPVLDSVDAEVEPSEPEPHATVPREPTVSEAPWEFTPEVASATEVTSEPAVAVVEPLTLKINHLQFWQPLEAEKSAEAESGTNEETEPEQPIVVNMARRSRPMMLRKESPFELEITFEITGTGGVELTQVPLQYHAECFVQNRNTREKIQLDNPSVGTLSAGDLTYTTRLPAVILQQSGLYRLEVVTRLDGGQVNPDFWELPCVQIA
jgi:hypothetical protein